MLLTDYAPHPTLVTRATEILRPRFPVIDAHNHLGEEFGGGWDKRPVAELLDVLDEANVRTYIDLDGGWGEDILHQHLDYFKAAAPERFCIFGGVDWSAWPEHGDHFGEWAAARLREQAARGARRAQNLETIWPARAGSARRARRRGRRPARSALGSRRRTRPAGDDPRRRPGGVL